MKSFRPGLAVLALVIAFVWVYVTRISKRAEAPAHPPAITEVAPLARLGSIVGMAPPAMPLPSSQVLSGHEEPAPPIPSAVMRFPTLPKVPQIVKDAERDPHALPTSLMNFAASLGDRMNHAMADESEATRFFPELESCVLTKGEDAAPTAQALCLENARVLSEKFKSLEPEYEALKVETDPGVLKLAQ